MNGDRQPVLSNKFAGLTAPEQKILPMHHGWVGGRGYCEGNNAPRGTVGLATGDEYVTVGIPVVVGVTVWV